MKVVRTAVHISALTVTILTGLTWLRAAPAPAPKAPAKEGPGGIKQLPPAGNDLSPNDRKELEAGAAKLGEEIDDLRLTLKAKPDLLALLPDVQIYHNAVRYPLAYHEPIDPAKARKGIADGLERAKQLRDGKPEWTGQSGPRGYISAIDGSVQPYILKLPASYKAGETKARRLDLFCHGRDEGLMELKFIGGKAGPSPGEQFHIDLYGRYCVASKFAGEVDCFEVIDDVKKRHKIDENRVVLTGFSMGGASVWHLTVHYPDVWVATSPGAGFAETKEYQGLAKSGELERTPWWQQKLWHWYDCPDYAANLANLPCIAYAGELDKQKQSGDVMEKAAAAEGIKLERIFGPNTAHAYEKEAKKDLDRRLDAYAAKGLAEMPTKVRLETYTLRYNKAFWVSVAGLERHWEQARVDASIEPDGIHVKTQNVTALQLHFPGQPLPGGKKVVVQIDGSKLEPTDLGDQNWTALLTKTNGSWRQGLLQPGLSKRHGLQGPIDDAFMDSFVIVKPTGKAAHEKVGAWAAAECDRAVLQWHRIFRGEARVRADDAVTEADIKDSNLVLFGDPSSNKVLAKIADKLPIKWTADAVTVGGKTYPADHHAPVLIYPNPLNPERYVVLNSGFTFREAANGTNSRQIPMLPDYAVVDLTEPPSAATPGKVVDAGFFGERWELLPDGGKR